MDGSDGGRLWIWAGAATGTEVAATKTGLAWSWFDHCLCLNPVDEFLWRSTSMVSTKEFSLYLFLFRQLHEISALAPFSAHDPRTRHSRDWSDADNGRASALNARLSVHSFWPRAALLLFAPLAADPFTGSDCILSELPTGPRLILLCASSGGVGLRSSALGGVSCLD